MKKKTEIKFRQDQQVQSNNKIITVQFNIHNQCRCCINQNRLVIPPPFNFIKGKRHKNLSSPLAISPSTLPPSKRLIAHSKLPTAAIPEGAKNLRSSLPQLHPSVPHECIYPDLSSACRIHGRNSREKSRTLCCGALQPLLRRGPLEISSLWMDLCMCVWVSECRCFMAQHHRIYIFSLLFHSSQNDGLNWCVYPTGTCCRLSWQIGGF